MTPQLQTAIVRSAWIAVATFALMSLTTYQFTGDWSKALVAGGIAALSPLVGRGAIEGMYDSQRQAKGNVHQADVRPL